MTCLSAQNQCYPLVSENTYSYLSIHLVAKYKSCVILFNIYIQDKIFFKEKAKIGKSILKLDNPRYIQSVDCTPGQPYTTVTDIIFVLQNSVPKFLFTFPLELDLCFPTNEVRNNQWVFIAFVY